MSDDASDDVATRLNELENRVDELEQKTEQLEETVEAQADIIASQREQLAEYRDIVDDIESTLHTSKDHRKHLQQRVHALEDDPETDATDTASPLQQLIRLPSKAASKLTANQERARFIAQDIREYAKKVPAGFAIDSTTVRKLLQAKEGQTPHTQTVTRVMDFLDRLGKEDVRIVKRRGTKRVVFSEHAVGELAATSTTSQAITDVVMGWK
ncbi:hypothetical protein SAMN04487949_2895 [Halogranum gelatinilyticum]|uniref:Uncharacterized protein n=1 Tax=Halogranum gelatinilyticum TaxID=660521 RepID=A0A1G9X948_9EURY|nr:hypothetical protein [Halogranum gelatinilyticum]SDM93322.1 hypothetical protein SAMN04487949_2895 [Halogranum gelatinilyticum]